MQTGVMAYRRNERVAAFWEETRKVYLEKGGAYWRLRSSGEQGAATLALARTDVRFLPLPPSFNARPYTELQAAKVFGAPVYHGQQRSCTELAPEAPTWHSRQHVCSCA